MTAREVPNESGAPRAFFGRRTGKRLHKGQRQLFETLLPAIEVDVSRPVDPAILFPRAARRHLEIGYGGGEHLVRMAQAHPDDGFIGCEVFTGGIGKLLAEIARKDLSNIAHYSDDAIALLAAMPAASLDCIHLLYPDPWPKTRHHKRRFVQTETLSELARVLKPGGTFRFATDIEDYANWTLAHLVRSPDFVWPLQRAGAWHTPYPGWQATRYEQKARREGRVPSFYFSFVRR